MIVPLLGTVLLLLLLVGRSSAMLLARQQAGRVSGLGMGKGFGAPKKAGDSAPGAPSAGFSNKQIKQIFSTSPCPCESGRPYGECCEPHHKRVVEYDDLDPVTITRARYSAYALGTPDYVIETSHTSNRDYQRHRTEGRDPSKAYKMWKKEILMKNSELFEFLRLEMLEGEGEHAEATMTTTKAEASLPRQIVRYNVIAREKGLGKGMIAFQEVALYVRDRISLQEIAAARPGALPVDSQATRWYYSSGTVIPMDQKQLEDQLKKMPKYAPADTIRDNW
eukprot:CAMPEP_0173191942 /NCGR_PEP_ID=MMETSP1141-20130122/13158_1 /TAXON_ID=483371 /ORGANISM="non described non described, Strain CCMP2298" /LENGTH=278 /DNA_ID=CAMNT_0014116173 /DNA_START=1 /DNA_END=837 /DNA_ORIENTATION=+